jgi:RimJ/RimL family protein N-acetyltransferase
MPLPTLQTPRLVLRPWTHHDIDELHALWTRPEVRRYLWDDESITRERAEQTVSEFIGAGHGEGLGGWLVLDASGATGGFVALMRHAAGSPELLYGLAPEWWGRGLATEAARAVLAYAFGPLACARVTAATDVPNTLSVRVLERIGMRLTRRGTLNGLDTLFYEMDRDDFANQRDLQRATTEVVALRGTHDD